MSKGKMINARLQQKHDLEKNWMLAENFIPKIGELIVYDAETSIEDITDKNGNLIRENICEYSRLKIGDGVTTVGNLAFADDDLRKELEKYVLKEEQATVKGKGLDSTQLHTGPVQALGKYQVVAGMYNELDPIAKYKEEYFSGIHVSMPGQDVMANFIKVTPPILDSINGIFKANIILEGSSWEPGDNYIKRENIEYEPGQEVTFVEYCIYRDGKNFKGVKIKDNTQELGKYAIMVGNGSSEDQRSNAYTLDWKGNASFSGKVFAEKTEELAKLSKVPHFYEEKNYSTEVPVIFSVYAEAYLNYETPWYAIGTEPFASFEKEAMYCVSIDEEKYYVISDGYSLKTVENTSDLAKQGDFIIRNHFMTSSSDDEPSEVSRNISLPGTTQEEHLITITKVNKSMVPEEIIPETIARKTDVQSFIINFTSVAPYCDKTIQEIEEAYNNNQNIEAYMIDSEVGKIHLSFAYTDVNVTAITPWIYSNGNAKSCQFVYDETNSEWLYNPILLSESFNIDYESTLAFDTSEIVIGQSTTSILGRAILGKMILG